MKKFYNIHYLVILVIVTITHVSVKAQNFKLIDVNRATNSNPENYEFRNNNQFAVFQGNFYFNCDDGIHGKELYKSDGSSAGTKLVKDITPGTGSSSISDITVSGNKLYFLATDSNYRQTIWLSDGTASGTMLVNNIASGFGSPFFQMLTDVNGTLFFFYIYSDQNGNHMELWKTDATGTAASMVAALNGFPQEIAVVNGKLFFSYYDQVTSLGNELYVSDGTAAGTSLVADINPNPYAGSNPMHLTAFNGKLYFAADDGSGNRLWVTDGTMAGTHTVTNTNNILLGLNGGTGVDPFVIISNTLYFQGAVSNNANATITGNELCKYDLIDPAADVTLVKDIIAGSTGSSPSNFTNVNGVLFFTAADDIGNSQLWRSDGTDAGTILIKDGTSGEKNYYYALININGTLFFSYNNNLGTELWKSDGTTNGTTLVKDIYPGSVGASPNYLTNYNGTIVFSATSHKGTELWRSDGTGAGTRLIKDINVTTTYGSYPTGFTSIGNKELFGAYRPETNSNLFITDGTAAGTQILNPAATVRTSSPPQKSFVNFKKENYFIDFNSKLWKTDGTSQGTMPLSIPPFISVDSGFTIDFTASERAIFVFTYNYRTNTSALWSTDGTAMNTYLLKADFSSFYNAYLTVVGKTLYFTNVDNNTGSELWKSDGTPAGTLVVKTIGSYNYNPLANLYNFKGKLYFDAYTNSGAGPLLWTSDGTNAGTTILNDITVIQLPFAQANGKLFFNGRDNTTSLYGNELYATDGTAGGTYLVKDINPGPNPSTAYSYPSSLVSGNKILYFIADDGIDGQELWKSDGTNSGTVLVKDITPGPNGTYFTQLLNVHDNLFFVDFSSVLWQSDGTDVNTNPINDIALNGLKQIMNLAANGNKLYLSGYTYAAGQEVYVGNISFASKEPTSTQRISFTDITPDVTSLLQLKLSPNPVRDVLQVHVMGMKQNTSAAMSIISSSGAVLKTMRLSGNERTEQLDVSSLASGVYIVKVMSADKVIYSQFLKF